jgi:hypothetical protein
LAALDDEPLSEIAKVNPPSTTWLSLAYASEVGRKAALNALKSMSGESSPCLLVDTAIEDVGGGSAASRVARLDGDTLSVIVKKAENYGALTPKTMKALKNFARNQKMGKLLTPAQIGYLEGILRDLVARGVIKRDSLDGDQDICNLVMDALGL